MECGYTERHVNVKTDLTDPQGIIRTRAVGFNETVAHNEMECGYTERHVNVQTPLTDPQGIIKS